MDLNMGVISLVSGVCLPLQTFQDRARFPSFRKHAGLAMLGLSGQLALEDMMESYLAEEQLAVRCSVVLG